MRSAVKKLTKVFGKHTNKVLFPIVSSVAILNAHIPLAVAQTPLSINYFGTPMFSTWDEADLAKSGTKGYFGGRLTLPEGADQWPVEFQEQLKQYKISHFASRETIHENEVPQEIKSFPYYELPTLSTDSVKIQMKRVARERGITEEQLEWLINKHEKKSQWAVFLDPWINIQDLNRDLDEVYPIPAPEPKPVQATNQNTKKRTQVLLRNKGKTAQKTTATKSATSTKTAKTTKTATSTTKVSKKVTKQVSNKTLKTAKS